MTEYTVIDICISNPGTHFLLILFAFPDTITEDDSDITDVDVGVVADSHADFYTNINMVAASDCC